MRAAALLAVVLALAGCQTTAPRIVLDPKPLPQDVLDCRDAPAPLDPDVAVQADIWPYVDALAAAGAECRRNLRTVRDINGGKR